VDGPLGRDSDLQAEHRYRQVLRFALTELYEHVGRPVIQRLQEMGIPEQSRIWFYPTSVFCALPLHSMGPIPSALRLSQYFSDIYVCSYIPTLGALIEARSHITPTGDYRPLLFVGSNSALRNFKERSVIRRSGIPSTLRTDERTAGSIAHDLQRHLLAHFSWYRAPEVRDPFSAGPGGEFTLLGLVLTQIPATKLAVLSANFTAGPDKGEGLEEGLHPVSAMNHHGFSSMVGTMWGMVGNDGPNFAEGFYETLLSQGAEDVVRLGDNSAEAVRVAVQKLRNKAPLERWVSWVHYGV
jgi:hypothetical protein